MSRSLAFAVLVLAVGCSSGHTAPKSAIVTATGRIGPLHVDRSDRGAIIAFAGRPDTELRGQEFDSPPYNALGYGCAKKSGADNFSITAGGPACRTIFFLDQKTGKLETFFTTETRYSEGHGVRIGMRSEKAERFLHKRLFEGCDTDIYVYAPTATLTIAFTGGRAGKHLHVSGARVYALVLHSRRRDAGVFDCL